METKKEVKTFVLDYCCDKCFEHKMEFNGLVLTSNPPLYPYTCKNCGYTINLKKRYPIIFYEEINENSNK